MLTRLLAVRLSSSTPNGFEARFAKVDALIGCTAPVDFCDVDTCFRMDIFSEHTYGICRSDIEIDVCLHRHSGLKSDDMLGIGCLFRIGRLIASRVHLYMPPMYSTSCATDLQ